MVLENFCQNKWLSESNVSKNTPKQFSAHAGEYRVKKLVQIYENIAANSASNIRKGFRHSWSDDSRKSIAMISDLSNLNSRNSVYRFSTLDNRKGQKEEKYRHESYRVIDSECYGDKAMSSNSSKSSFRLFLTDADKDARRNGTSPNRPKRKEDFLKLFTSTTKSKYNNSLPHPKKKENNIGKITTASRDKKSNVLSFDNSKTIQPKDGRSSVDNLETKTGAIKKQNISDATYRKRRESYVLATQIEETPKKSYVSETVFKFQKPNDIKTNKKNKFEEEINQLLDKYHINKKYSSNRITREELQLQLDNVLLNNYKQISADNQPDMRTQTSAAENHKVLNENNIHDDIITLVVEHHEDTDTEFIKQNNSEGQPHSQIEIINVDSELNVREKLSAKLNKVICDDNLKTSVENLCDTIVKDLQNISDSAEIKQICVSVETEDDMKQSDVSSFNIQEQDVLLRANDEKVIRKVSNLVNYFSEKIAENTSDSRKCSINRRTSSASSTKTYDSVVINKKQNSIEGKNNNYEDHIYENITLVRSLPLQDEIDKYEQENISLPYTDSSTNGSYAEFEENETSAINYNVDKQDMSTLTLKEKKDLLIQELQTEIVKKQNSFKEQNNKEITIEEPKRRSRLYSAKFGRGDSTNKQDNNNNKTEKQIFEKILNDTDFQSDSGKDYSFVSIRNVTEKLIEIDKKLATRDWVYNQDFNYNENENENTEEIYERIKRSGSQGILCTIYDDQNNVAMRLSRMDITEDECQKQLMDEKKIEQSEKEIRRSIDEIQDNSKRRCLINELITTEKRYIHNSLHRLVNEYMPEMDCIDIPRGLMGKSRIIFGNADMLYEDHKTKILPELEKHTCIEDLAKCFLNHETTFKLYPLYSKNKPKSDYILKDYGFYFKKKQEELNDKLDLASYLLSPIQRLAKYCLLLKSLVKECEKENIECCKLKDALEMLNKQMRMGNDLIALDSITDYNGCIRDQGEVLLRDTFIVYPPNKKSFDGMIFLFQECLIITAIQRQDYKETFRYRHSFQLTDMGISDLQSESPEIEVWYRKHDCNAYRLRTKNNELKEKWVKVLFDLLWKQFEANKKKQKQEQEKNGIKDTRVPLARPYSVPHKAKGKLSSASTASSKSMRKKHTPSCSADTIWYTLK